MAISNLARFTINGTPSEDASGKRGYDAVASQTLALTLEANPALGVLTIKYDIHDITNLASPLNSLYDSTLTIVENGLKTYTTSSVNSTIHIVIPSGVDISAYLIRATAVTATGSQVFERLLCVRLNGLRMTVPAESLQYAQRGWSDALNELTHYVAHGGGASSLVTDEIPGTLNPYPLGSSHYRLAGSTGVTEGGEWSIKTKTFLDTALADNSIDIEKLDDDGAANGQALVFDSTSGFWKPGDVGGAASLVTSEAPGTLNMFPAGSSQYRIAGSDGQTVGGVWDVKTKNFMDVALDDNSIDLEKLDDGGATNGQVPIFNSTSGFWIPGTIGGGSATLVTGEAPGTLNMFPTGSSSSRIAGSDGETEGGVWDVKTKDFMDEALDDHSIGLAKLDDGGATNGQVPIFNSTSGFWIPGTIGGGSASLVTGYAPGTLNMYPLGSSHYRLAGSTGVTEGGEWSIKTKNFMDTALEVNSIDLEKLDNGGAIGGQVLVFNYTLGFWEPGDVLGNVRSMFPYVTLVDPNSTSIGTPDGSQNNPFLTVDAAIAALDADDSGLAEYVVLLAPATYSGSSVVVVSNDHSYRFVGMSATATVCSDWIITGASERVTFERCTVSSTGTWNQTGYNLTFIDCIVDIATVTTLALPAAGLVRFVDSIGTFGGATIADTNTWLELDGRSKWGMVIGACVTNQPHRRTACSFARCDPDYWVGGVYPNDAQTGPLGTEVPDGTIAHPFGTLQEVIDILLSLQDAGVLINTATVHLLPSWNSVTGYTMVYTGSNTELATRLCLIGEGIAETIIVETLNLPLVLVEIRDCYVFGGATMIVRELIAHNCLVCNSLTVDTRLEFTLCKFTNDLGYSPTYTALTATSPWYVDSYTEYWRNLQAFPPTLVDLVKTVCV
jgi:hypothetical protein